MAPWRIVDLSDWLFEEFRVSVSKQTLSRRLRAIVYRKAMTKLWTICAAALTVALLSVGGAQAGMTPAAPGAGSDLLWADCAVGFHLGPAGACIRRHAEA